MNTDERIRNLRQQRGWTQNDLAQRTNLERKSIIRYEAGTNIPSGKALAYLATAFNVTTDYLLGLSDDTLPTPITEADLSPPEREVLKTLRRARTQDEGQRAINALLAFVERELPS